MPGLPQEPKIAGAICAPPTNNGDSTENVQQPRQPNNLQGLLRFAMDATRSEDAPNASSFQQMDEERKAFLENALNSMTVNVIELLQKQIETLEKIEEIKPDDDITKYEEALDTISEHVDHIDIANDFHKIGGFKIIYPCLKCSNPKIRSKACELLAELCQNNPYCQRVVLENEFIPKLLEMLEKDDDPQVALKALYAISGIVRHSQEGFNQLIHYNGLPILLKTLKRIDDDKFIIKATFLLAALCGSQPDLKSRLVFLDYVPLLISLISQERKHSHEHVMSLLLSIVEDSQTALNECKNERYNLKEVLKKYADGVKNKEEYMEDEQNCRRLQSLLFGSR